MNVLVIGSGGREHALAWKLAQSPHVTRMWCAPGNAGIAEERLSKNQLPVECISIAAEDLPKLLAFAQENKVAFTVVGPDNPLALGIVDLFQKNGQRIWGPNQKAAQFESSKVFSQDFMERHGIPTARSGTFSDAKSAKEFATLTRFWSARRSARPARRLSFRNFSRAWRSRCMRSAMAKRRSCFQPRKIISARSTATRA
jgi:phosphoribosylamine--glycine ligase